MITWKEEYLIGVAEIDEQHQKLFEIAGRIYDLLENSIYGDKYDQIMAVIQELKDYTIYHFQCEEAYMEKIGYKRLLSQKVAHSDFIEKVNNVDFDHIDMNQDAYVMEMMNFIVDWIGSHIIEKDKLITSDVK